MQQIELHCKACNIRLMDYLDESDPLALMDDEDDIDDAEEEDGDVSSEDEE